MSKKIAKIYRNLNEDTVAFELWHAEEIAQSIQEAEELEQKVPILVIKTRILNQIVEMLSKTGMVRSSTKLGKMLFLREKRESTGLAHGIAIPHVRTDHVKDFALCIIILKEPVPYEALDGEPVSIIIGMATPKYDDHLHLKLLAKFSELLSFESFRQELLQTTTADEVMHLFRREE